MVDPVKVVEETNLGWAVITLLINSSYWLEIYVHLEMALVVALILADPGVEYLLTKARVLAEGSLIAGL